MAATCRSCGADVLWAQTPSGKRIPLNPEPDMNGNLHLQEAPELYAVLVPAGHTCPRAHYLTHFATCPQATGWRTRRSHVGSAQ